MAQQAALPELLDFCRRHRHLVVVTGAGISASSGIPTYRDHLGRWQRGDPILHQDFLSHPEQRRRYWARSAVGWPRVAAALPNPAHHALAALEAQGRVALLVTQNVDRLHQRAGQRAVVDLHGRLDRVLCLDCGCTTSRRALQSRLLTDNPVLAGLDREPMAPDGDALIDHTIAPGLREPSCRRCGGTIMPDVVFYGGNVPRDRVQQVLQALEEADALLVVGSSLSVYSAFRFCRAAARQGLPIAAVNQGQTRADELLQLKVAEDCASALVPLARALGA